jgi:hypothetical protein
MTFFSLFSSLPLAFYAQVCGIPVLYFTRHSIPLTVGWLILLDSLDFFSRRKEKQQEKQEKPSKEQEHFWLVLHKVMSVVQYAVGIYFLSPMLPKHVLHVALSFLVMRAIGIIHHAQSKDSTFFIVFFDFIKEYLLLFYVYYPELTISMIAKVIVFKIAYEYLIHKDTFFRRLNQTIVNYEENYFPS